MSRDPLPFPTYGDDATVVEEHAPVSPLGLRLVRPKARRTGEEATLPITWRFHAVAAEREAEEQRAAWRAGLGAGARPVAPVRRTAGGAVAAEAETLGLARKGGGEAKGGAEVRVAEAGPGATPAGTAPFGAAAAAGAGPAPAKASAAGRSDPRPRPGRKVGLGDAPVIVWEPPAREERARAGGARGEAGAAAAVVGVAPAESAKPIAAARPGPRPRRPSRAWLAIGLVAIAAAVGPVLAGVAFLVAVELLAPVLAVAVAVTAVAGAGAFAATLLLAWLLRAARSG